MNLPDATSRPGGWGGDGGGDGGDGQGAQDGSVKSNVTGTGQDETGQLSAPFLSVISRALCGKPSFNQ